RDQQLTPGGGTMSAALVRERGPGMARKKVSAFGTRLRQLREEAGLTQEGLAERAGMHRLGIAKLERGDREPAWATVERLCQALGVRCTKFEGTSTTEPEPQSRPKRGRPRKQEG